MVSNCLNAYWSRCGLILTKRHLTPSILIYVANYTVGISRLISHSVQSLEPIGHWACKEIDNNSMGENTNHSEQIQGTTPATWPQPGAMAPHPECRHMCIFANLEE